jgi:uncharacterized protein (TIGR02118 family)
MISYFVRYENLTGNTEQFLNHYRDLHVPILARWPGIQAIYLHTPATVQDTRQVIPGESTLMAQMVFASDTDLAMALRSDERAEARADFERFPSFRARVTHQAMRGEVMLGRALG